MGPVQNIEDEYSDVYEGIGKLKMLHKIQLVDNYEPMIHAARKVALRDKLMAELQRLEALDMREKVEEPTEWVHSIVILERQDKPARLCISMSPRVIVPTVQWTGRKWG